MAPRFQPNSILTDELGQWGLSLRQLESLNNLVGNSLLFFFFFFKYNKHY